MSGQIPTRWPDVEGWVIGFVTAAKIAAVDSALTGVVVRNLKPTTTSPYRQVIVSADYGQLITPITRYVRIRLRGWSVKANNVSDIEEAFRLADVAAFVAQSAPRDGNPIVSLELESGPLRVKDDLSGIEYQSSVLLAEAKAL